MVKKLFKYEFKAMLRFMLPIECIVLGIGLITRIIQFFETDTTVFQIFNVSSIILLVVALLGGIVAAEIYSIVRYYKNLFTREGYLSFTLPVTFSQHILVKAVTSVVVGIMSFIVSLISFCIASSGEFLEELSLAAGYIIKRMYANINGFHLTLYIIEVLVLFVVLMFQSMLLFYACISIGQTAKKNRVLWAILTYYIYYVITQIVYTVITVIITIVGPKISLDPVFKFIEKHPYASGHIFFIAVTILICAFCLLYFYVSHTVMRKKLNLE